MNKYLLLAAPVAVILFLSIELFDKERIYYYSTHGNAEKAYECPPGHLDMEYREKSKSPPYHLIKVNNC